MHKIKFGTDGWRAVIAKDFTVENVARVSKAAALWVLNNYSDPSVVIGYDSRFGGKLFAETAARIFARNKGLYFRKFCYNSYGVNWNYPVKGKTGSCYYRKP